MALQVRVLSRKEIGQLQRWAESGQDELKIRARIILLSAEGYRVPQIGAILGRHPTNLRKWIHRFNEKGCQGLISAKSGGRPPRITGEQKRQIVELAKTDPRELGLSFNRWTLHRLATEAQRQQVVDSISHEYVRQILSAAGYKTRLNGKNNRMNGNGASHLPRTIRDGLKSVFRPSRG
jgi:transposase